MDTTVTSSTGPIISASSFHLSTSRSNSTISKSTCLHQQSSSNLHHLKVTKNHPNLSNGKNRSPCVPNQPSEALCHFMFELAKNLVQRAGGTTSTSLFVGPTHNYPPPHRNLHLLSPICNHFRFNALHISVFTLNSYFLFNHYSSDLLNLNPKLILHL